MRYEGQVVSAGMGTESVRACQMDEDMKIFHMEQAALTFEQDQTQTAVQNAKEISAKTLSCVQTMVDWMESHGHSLAPLKESKKDLFNSNYFCTIKDEVTFRGSGELVTGQSNALRNQPGMKKSIAGGNTAHKV